MIEAESFASATGAWRTVLRNLVLLTSSVSPRGRATVEKRLVSFRVPLLHPVVLSSRRALSYQFMAAEALWIVTGDDSLAALTPYAPSYAKFSDDGETLYGAYGPRFAAGLPHAVESICRDTDTRQAVIQIWRPPPEGGTKDVPCTLSATFLVRDGALHGYFYMRSSDTWLGLPYDIFSFACMTFTVLAQVRAHTGHRLRAGTLGVTLVSSHLYEINRVATHEVLAERIPDELLPVPDRLLEPGALVEFLTAARARWADGPRWDL